MSDEDQIGSGALPRRLDDALNELYRARKRFLFQNVRTEPTRHVLQQFHAAVVNCYWEIRQYRNQVDDEDWTERALWHGEDGAVRGLETLEDVTHVSRRVPDADSRHGSSSAGGEVRSHLPGDVLLNISAVIDDVGQDLREQDLPVDEGFNPAGKAAAAREDSSVETES